MAESVLPLIHDPNTAAGRDALNIPPLEGVRFVSFRLRPGDDVSCLNLYQPRNPRIMAPPASFLDRRRSVALLKSQLPGGVIPAIADANSMTYVLHLKLGEDFVLNQTRFRIVAALEDSLFQSELLISEKNFLRLFPDVEGYRFFLLDVAPQRAREVTGVLEEALSDYGFDVQSTEARLAELPQSGEHLPFDLSQPGRAGPGSGHHGSGGHFAAQRTGAPPRVGVAARGRISPRASGDMVLAENLLLLLLGLATGHGVRAAGDCAGGFIAWRPLAGRVDRLAAGGGARDRDRRLSGRHTRGAAVAAAGRLEIGVNLET